MLTDPEPLQGFEPPPDPADEREPEDLHLLEVDNRDRPLYATGNLNGELPRSNTEHSREQPAPATEGHDEALFHAARHRECAPEPDFVAFDTDRQLAEANRWDHAPVPRERLLELNEMAADFFTAGYADSWGPPYVSGRLGTDLADHPTFRPGYAPAGWTNLTDHLRGLGVGDDEILAAGLGRVASTGRIIDQFRDRLVLPIRNRDEIRGFIGRRNPTMTDGDKAGPKYLNTAQTDLFDKSVQLFGLSEGRAALDAGATPILVEGFFDAIAVTLAGDGKHVGVAPLGTSFTQTQANELRPYIGPGCPGATVATDADLPGEIAAQRAFWMLTARGDSPRHAVMPSGQDPAGVLEHDGPTVLRACLDDAQPLARHLLDQRLDHLSATPHAVLSDCAAIIAAQPPHTWTEQVDYVTASTNYGQGAIQEAVADAATQWTLDPLAGAQRQIADLAAVRARLQRGAQARPAAVGQSNAAAAQQRLHAGQPGETDSNRPPASAGPNAQEPRPVEAWHLAHNIDSQLTAGEDWSMLARAIQDAHSAGYNVARELGRLAAGQQRSTERPAAALAYRLRAATKTASEIEPTPSPDPIQATASSASRSPVQPRRTRREPDRPMR